MRVIADLHLHSVFSDGHAQPDQLISKLKLAGVEYCALADHDTVEGVNLFLSAAENESIKAFSGIELSCYENDTQIHILGYNIDHNNPELREDLQQILLERKHRMKEILGLLNKQNVKVDADEFFTRYPGPYWGRPQIAQFLVEKGLVKNFQTAFDQFLGVGRSAYKMNSGFSTSEGIDWIHKFNGIAILAHPALYMSVLPLVYWQNFNFDGIELIHPSQKSMRIVREIRRLSIRKSWLISGGSDFHGSSRSHYVPQGITKLDLPSLIRKIA